MRVSPVPLCLLLSLFPPAVIASGQNAAEPVYVSGGDLQAVLDRSPPHAVIQCDPNHTYTWTAPLVIRKPVTLAGLHAQLPPKLGRVALVEILAPGVSFIDFELTGNGDSVAPEERAPLLAVYAGQFRVERGTFLNSSKDGVMIDGDGPRKEDIVGGVVRDVVGRGVRRDTVSISGGSGVHRVRNILVDNVRSYHSLGRGAVEVSDGTDYITVRKIYAESCIYAVDVQDHNLPEQSNHNLVIDDVFAVDCKFAIRTSNKRSGHTNLSVHNVTARHCLSPIQISRTANVHVSNIRVFDHEGAIAPVLLQACHGVALRDVVIECRAFTGTAVLLENCDESLIDGVTLRAAAGTVANAVRYRLTAASAFSGLRIANVLAPHVAEAGIVVESVGPERATLTDYRIVGNLATVADRINGARGIVASNQP